ncbi:MAG: magnesium-translocating P-type ATPase [Candidatus Obscuribacterales bacterium]|nr:magnesium-translocating P-type ATPase [Candidatus Obscuribacterales bacterium]
MKSLDSNSSELFWSLPVETVISNCGGSSDGLSDDIAEQRMASLARKTVSKHWSQRESLELLIDQFKSPIIILLLFAAILSAFFGEKTDAIIILTIVLISGLLGFWQESGARSAIAKMLEVIKSSTTVVRQGKEIEIASNQVVQGDILKLTAGATIPADCLILESKELFVDEAALTGETFPVEKHTGAVARESAINMRTNCLFAGTHIVSGSATALAVLIGDKSEFGKVSRHVAQKAPESDFERGIRMFGYLLMEVTLILVLLIFAINVFLHRPVLDSFMFSLALAVGLTPQLLPAIISINLATGARRMAEAKVIVKRLAAIESFGSMNVLCSDKTGTITEGLVSLKATINVEGNESEKVKLFAFLNSTMETGFSNPIDEAVRKLTGIDASNYGQLDEIPYDFHRKRLSILVSDKASSENLMISKGSLSTILEVCNRADLAGGALEIAEVQNQIDQRMKQLSSEGSRVLGISYKRTAQSKLKRDDEVDMILAGLLVLDDPPKQGIARTISELNELGVSLKIITGDNHLVAAAVAKQVGFDNPKVLNASEFHKLKPEALTRLVNSIDVFAEVEPNQKEQIIVSLKKAGNVVGYIGDGINDAPALRVADIGISVNNAVDVAKETAQLVMLEHDLEVLVKGIREGRMTFANTLKYIFTATSANFGNMFSMAGASLFLSFLPLLPKQILLTNLLTDFSQMTISTDQVDAEFIAKPRRWDIRFIRTFMLVFGTISSVFDFLTFFVLLSIMHADMREFRTGWFIESVISASLVVLIVRTWRSVMASRPSAPLLCSTALVILATVALPFTPIGNFLGFVPLPLIFFLVLPAIVLAYLLAAEFAKHQFLKKLL